MFQGLDSLPDDPIFTLSASFRADNRSPKLDLGVGVFVDANGNTPVLKAVKEAEQRIWQTQESKRYQPIEGNARFLGSIALKALGNTFDLNRMRVNQSCGGTGGLYLVGNVIKSLHGKERLWLPNPTWANHELIFSASHLDIHRYNYLATGQKVAQEEIFATLSQLDENDAVLLHGCCHNPSGADFSQEDWKTIARLVEERGFLPIVDMAYQGLGAGYEEDAWGVRYLLENVREAFVIISCSKNFGLYSERVGAVISVCDTQADAQAVQTYVNRASRQSVSMAPDHAALTVATILEDEALSQMWMDELNSMRAFLVDRRHKLASALGDWDFICHHQGMFSLLPLGVENVKRLREEFAIYCVGTGRINLSGLYRNENIDYFADCLKRIL